MKKKECCIAAAGPSPLWIRPGAFVIAADAGLEKLLAAGIRPDLILGDFDSLGGRPTEGEILSFPVRKDDTDTMLAVKEALRRGFDVLYLSGASGGRLDHTVANLQTLLYAAKQGVEAYLCAGSETATVRCGGRVRFRPECRGRLSVFALGEAVSGVTLKGLLYETETVTLTNAFPLGVSNEFTGRVASVSAEHGPLLLIWDGTPDDILCETEGTSDDPGRVV